MILDIIVVLIIALCTFIGYKKGFVKVVIKLITIIVAIILSLMLQKSVAKFIGEKAGLKNNISMTIENKLVEITADENSDKKVADIPVLTNTINRINKAASEEKQQVIADSANKIVEFIINGISFIIIFIVVSLTMGIIGLILNTVVQLPVLKTLNGVLGASTAFILMMFRISIVLAIISVLSPLELLTGVTDYINDSCIIKWLYENNIIINIIGRKLL